MRWVRFLLKFTFICNLCFLFCFIIQRTSYADALGGLVKSAAVLGFVVAPYLNIVVSLIVIAGLIAKKFRWREIHPYIFILNLLILLLQFY
jgi:hypothetical protein